MAPDSGGVDPLRPAETDEARTARLLRTLELDVRRRLDGLLHGDYRGLVSGHGSELGETRLYTPSDDVRRIDWNVTARTQQVHVRDTVADRELETRVVVDLSPSVAFGTAIHTKRDLIIAATAAIAHLTARTGNRFGAEVITADGGWSWPPRQGRVGVQALLHRLVTTPVTDGGRAALGPAMAHTARGHHRRGLAVVISDFLAEEGWERSLRRVTARHETLCIEVLDPRELELPDVGMLTVADPETGAVREIDTGSRKLRRRYAQAATDQRQAIAAAIRWAGADHLVLRTDRDWLLDVARFVDVRRRRNGHAGAAAAAAGVTSP
jgi:uncharacterized protein (DUF58 family)